MTNPNRLYLVSMLFLFTYGFKLIQAQNVISDMDHDAHQVYDRMIILSDGRDTFLHSSIKPYWRQDLVTLADSFTHYEMSEADAFHVQSIWDQNNEFTISSSDSQSTRYRSSRHPLWKTFYRTPAHFYEVDIKDSYLRANFMLRLAAGKETEEGVASFINQRGISLRGGVGQNVFFQTSFYDSQVRFPNYINQYTDSSGVVPGVALYKDFNSSLFTVTEGRDFLLANAFVGINLGKYIGFQLGHNQYFIGDGIRSLFLSDFSPPYFSLRINTRIWKIHYQNIFAEVSADNFMSVSGFSGAVPKKYMAAHYLSYKPNRHFSIGLFEGVIFDRPDHQFELQYLNPIILYRTIEGWIGSPDNVILGLSSRLDLKKKFSLYGQFLLDDISLSQIFDGHLDWWGNKFGYQLGGKYINAFGLRDLDAQIEWNSTRPYTFSHYDEHANYSNYKQPMAHSLGANFNEFIISIRYQLTKRLLLQSQLYVITTGEDIDTFSYGSNVIIPNTKRPADYGHFIGQGIATDIVYSRTGLQYELTSGFFIDGEFVFRKKTSAQAALNLDTRLFQVGIRYNMARREDVF